MTAVPQPSSRPLDAATADLMLRETNHRCSNDLQMVVSLLALQSGRASNAEVRAVLADTIERVGVLARSRAALNHQVQHSLGAALRQVCEALHAQCEPRSILMSLEVGTEGGALTASHITTLALVVNELATNAIKHAFEANTGGHISIKTWKQDKNALVITVDDDGLPFPELESTTENVGLGLGLVRRMVKAVGGTFFLPPPGTKLFEIRVPVATT